MLDGFTLSDYVLILCLAPASWFMLSYGVLSPWYRSALGWVVFLYAISVVALLGLIVFGVVFGNRVHELARLGVAAAVLLSLTAKVVILHVERRAGRSRRNTDERNSS